VAPGRNRLCDRWAAATAFQQLFAAFRRWHPEAKVKLAHVWFGSILGEDGKPFKTRLGEVVKLADLLDEAEERAFKVVTEKNNDRPEAERLPESELPKIAPVVGLAAIKYADLLPNRQSDYVFSWTKCWHYKAIPRFTCCMLTHAFEASSAREMWTISIRLAGTLAPPKMGKPSY